MAEPATEQTPEVLARTWLAEIEAAEKEKDRQRWLKRCQAIQRIYKEQQEATDPTESRRSKRYALLWSNIQTLAPAVYSRTPTAVVTRRFKDADPVGRVCSEILERALNFSLEEADFASAMTGCRDEFLLFAQGQMWVRYVPTIETVTPPPAPGAAPAAQADAPDDGDGQIGNDPAPYERVSWEEVIADRIHHDDFLHNPARSWEEVRWVARRAYMTRPELVARFPECGAEIPLDWSPTDNKDATEDMKKAAIYEVWDLISRKVMWFSKGYTTKALDDRADPLQLKNFFPCPKALFGTLSPDSLVPIPDFMYWQDQQAEINVLTQRIDKLISALKVKGLYSGAEKDKINALLSADDNVLIPVDSWAALGDKGGLKGIVDWFPLDVISAALKQCLATRDQIIKDVFQITGISDIQRGDSDPNETAAAQQIKVNWGSSRVRERQNEIARFSRDVIRIMGEIIASKFGPDVLGKMTGVELLTNAEKAQIQQLQAVLAQQQQAAQMAQQGGQQPPPQPPIPPEAQALLQKAKLLDQPSWEDAMAVLRNPELRAFRIDIETDSTVEPNDQEEKQRRIEFVQAVGKYLAESLPVVQAAPQMLPVIVEGLKFLVRGFRVGREMEDIIDRAADELQAAAQQAASQPPQPPPMSPADQAKAQAARTTAQANVIRAQAHQQQAQNDAQGNQVELAKVQSAHQIGMAGVQAENNRTEAEAQVATHSTIADTIQKAIQRREVHEMNDTSPLMAPTR
jgi:hypothetical protein